jgi:hypothetical protein
MCKATNGNDYADALLELAGTAEGFWPGDAVEFVNQLRAGYDEDVLTQSRPQRLKPAGY